MDIKKHIQSIIEEITENKDIANIFLKVQVLAHLLKDDQFSQWFKSEQSGYKDDLLPEYRIIRVSVHGSGIAGIIRYP